MMRRCVILFFITTFFCVGFGETTSIVPSHVTPELTHKRSVGFCAQVNSTSFAESIDAAIDISLELQHPLSGWMLDAFKVHRLVPISLASERLCQLEAKTLMKPMSVNGVKIYNKFVLNHNSMVADGDVVGVRRSWQKFFYCLAKIESLGSPDRPSYNSNAKAFGLKRTAGVVFHSDQMHYSGNSIGLYQFAPEIRGNILPCIEAWNDIYPTCKIHTSGSRKYAAKILGEPNQAFNAFCGVQKILQSFYIQSNSSDKKYWNKEDQCVSISNNTAYMHFGPLLNSTGTNLEKLMSCVVK